MLPLSNNENFKKGYILLHALLKMNKKKFTSIAVVLVFAALFSSYAYASTKVNVNSVRLNGDDLAKNKRNFIKDTNDLDIVVSLTALTNLSGI